MNRETSQVVRFIVSTLMVCTVPSVAMADYAIESYTIEAGGTTSSGGGFALTGTIELADPSVRVMTGDGFELTGQLCPSVMDADGPQAIAMVAEDEGAAVSQCGSGLDQALPLLMVLGIFALFAIPRRLRRTDSYPRASA